jgi:hypothetical protein
MRCVAVVVALAATASFAGETKYEMADLQALEKQGSWEELVEHLEDLPPSKRDATWAGLAERACSSYLGAVPIDEHKAEYALMLADRILKRYPALKQSKVFMSKRAEVGLKAFGYTYGNYRHSQGEDPWIDKMKEFVKDDTLTPDLPERAAKKVQNYLVAYCAWPFWKMAIDRGTVVCKEVEFQKSIVAAIGDGVWKAETSDVAQNKCWAEVKAPLLAELESAKGSDFKKNACPLLKAKGVPAGKCDSP